MKIDWVQIVGVAFTVVGLIQFAKGFIKSQKFPTWIWGILLPIGCVGIAAAFLYLPSFVTIALLAMSVSQLGYENIVQLVEKWIGKA